MKRHPFETKRDVLMIGTDPDSRGGISSVITMYHEAGLLNHRVRFLASYRDGSLPVKLWHYINFLAQYLAVLATGQDIRLVHVHTASYGSFLRKSLVIALARLTGRKVILHVHGAQFHMFYDQLPKPLQRLTRKLLQSCDVIIALSQQWRDDLRRISGNPDIRVIYNPTRMQPSLNPAGLIDTENIDAGQDKKAVLQYLPRPVHFLFMGRLGERKGVYDIIESVRGLAVKSDGDGLPMFRIHLYGDGELSAVQARIDESGVSDVVAACGWIDGSRKDATFRSADVLLLPSYHEGLPVSVLEAMAYGLPVLASDVGGIPEAVADGENGFLVRAGDHAALRDRIGRLASSAELRQKMGERGRAMAAEKFALPVIIQQLEQLYDELAGR